MKITTELDANTSSAIDSETAPNCDVYHLFLASINSTMRKSSITRLGLADRMNDALQVGTKEVDVNQINKWLAPSSPSTIPMHYLPALAWALGTTEFINTLLLPIHFKVVCQKSLLLQRHAELEMEVQERKLMQQQIQETLLIKES